MDATHVLGLSRLTHDPAAVVIGERGVVAAIEETKLLRTRTAAGIPRAAIRFCLRRASLRWEDIGAIAIASKPRRLPARELSSSRARQTALAQGRELDNDRLLRLIGAAPGTKVYRLDHHLCHAASAFYASPAERAVVLTLDEEGDGRSGMVALGEGTELRALRTFAFPHSLGWIFSQVTTLLGFEPHREEHKTQWLGITGEPVFLDLFLRIFRRRRGAALQLDPTYFNRGFAGRVAFSPKFYRGIGLDPETASRAAKGEKPEISETLRRQLAASVQQACALAAVELGEAYRKRTGATSLCLAGGLFLNPVIVSEVERNTKYEHVYVQPAAGNEGTALGAAWLVWHTKLGRPRVEPPSHLYWGPAFSNQDIKQVLENCKARFRWHDSDEPEIAETIRLLEAGKIVAWYRGAAEFGPRALGNRSLLASPWAEYVRENLNEYIKHREAYRPFALAVPAEDAERYFEASEASRFMATLVRAKPEARGLLEGFLLPGDRVRLHVVERAANPELWQLLRRFGERAPAPILVNTSFNLFGEPLVISPRDAVRSYFCSGTDALVMGSFSLTKS
jgi:carbamoyltransferase